jgi:succinate-acetate transporter protein
MDFTILSKLVLEFTIIENIKILFVVLCVGLFQDCFPSPSLSTQPKALNILKGMSHMYNTFSFLLNFSFPSFACLFERVE